MGYSALTVYHLWAAIQIFLYLCAGALALFAAELGLHLAAVAVRAAHDAAFRPGSALGAARWLIDKTGL